MKEKYPAFGFTIATLITLWLASDFASAQQGKPAQPPPGSGQGRNGLQLLPGAPRGPQSYPAPGPSVRPSPGNSPTGSPAPSPGGSPTGSPAPSVSPGASASPQPSAAPTMSSRNIQSPQTQQMQQSQQQSESHLRQMAQSRQNLFNYRKDLLIVEQDLIRKGLSTADAEKLQSARMALGHFEEEINRLPVNDPESWQVALRGLQDVETQARYLVDGLRR